MWLSGWTSSCIYPVSLQMAVGMRRKTDIFSKTLVFCMCYNILLLGQNLLLLNLAWKCSGDWQLFVIKISGIYIIVLQLKT